jgi:glycerophosphoryl diester phosphodiesterase
MSGAKSRWVVKGAAAIGGALVIVGMLEAGAFDRWPHAFPSYVPVAGLTLIAHAAGGMPNAVYTNSREAFDASYRRGFCLIETDFRFARDGKLVLVHDWSDAYGPLSQLDLLLAGPPISADFMAHATRYGLTPQDLSGLLTWMAAHPSVSIITDTKEDNVRFLRALTQRLDATAKSRFIVQIYSPEELPEARRLGFEHIIFTLYKSQMSDADVIDVARRENLFGVTMPVARARTGLAPRLVAAGVRVFAHTVNSAKEGATLAKAGVAGVYTDYLTPAAPCR